MLLRTLTSFAKTQHPNMRVCHCYFNHFALKFAVLCLSTHAHMQLGHHVESEPDLNLLAGPPPPSDFWLLWTSLLLDPTWQKLASPVHDPASNYTYHRNSEQAMKALGLQCLLSVQPQVQMLLIRGHNHSFVSEPFSCSVIPAPCLTHHNTAKEKRDWQTVSYQATFGN